MGVFYMPVKVYTQEEAVGKNASMLASFGRKALLVTGRNSARANGSLEDVCKALDREGVSHVVFDRIEANPSVRTVMEACSFGIAEGADFVVGIGGGSPMDAAKAVALMMSHPEEDSSYLYRADGDDVHIPVVCVPTTCGTGSEVTAVSVLTDTQKGIKKSIPHKIFPDLALVDGKYLRFASEKVLANTAFDALTHLIESGLNRKADCLSLMCVEEGLRLWSASLPILRGERKAEDADFANMMSASTMAGMAIAQTGTAIPHGLSYSVTVKLGVEHGKACAYFTAGDLSAAPQKEREKLLSLAGFSGIRDFQSVLHSACGKVQADADTLKKVLEEDVEEMCSNSAKLKAAPFEVDRSILEEIAWYEFR